MKERPILFSGPMVQAILSGNKTQTRRVIKPQPPHGKTIHPYCTGSPDLGWSYYARRGDGCWDAEGRFYCPYGVSGNRLWVRETFRVLSWPKTHFALQYLADGAIETYWPNYDRGKVADIDAFVLKQVEKGWKPSIHMPAWASRITLEVCSVRVERLQDISAADARAEGIPQTYAEAKSLGLSHDSEPGHEWDNRTSIENYARLWNSINEKRGYGWDTNPYVWVVEFRKVEVAA